eukprot:scaffold77453_cov72-Phaeocystis_antarctica.AAC.6
MSLGSVVLAGAAITMVWCVSAMARAAARARVAGWARRRPRTPPLACGSLDDQRRGQRAAAPGHRDSAPAPRACAAARPCCNRSQGRAQSMTYGEGPCALALKPQ